MISNHRIKVKTFVFLIAFAVLMIIIGVSILHTGEVKQRNTLVLLTFGINMVLSFVMLVKAVRKHAYSFDMMFWLFGLFFFGIAPTLQHITNTYAWNLIPQLSEVLRTNLYVLIWLACYLLGKSINRSIKITRSSARSELSPQYTYKISKRALNCLLVVSILITVYFVYTVGLTNLFARATNKNEELTKGGM